jgi:uncharacterized protein HemX
MKSEKLQFIVLMLVVISIGAVISAMLRDQAMHKTEDAKAMQLKTDSAAAMAHEAVGQ